MDLFKPGMKGPSRPAPAVPMHRYSPVTNWNDDPFGADVFEPTPHVQKKKPPPRPPPPKINSRQPDIPVKPSHFLRKPTVLSSLLTRKTKSVSNSQNANGLQTILPDFNSEVDTNRMFQKCELKNVQTGALIDLSSPPSSPTFTTRSSSDGLSVDSFGSDATTSTNNHNAHNGGNMSQPESGFEDDFDLFLHSRKKEETIDDFIMIDPFSPQPAQMKSTLMKKSVISKELFDISSHVSQPVPLLNGPTIIRAKPARPKPPDNAALLKTTCGGHLPVMSMNVNTTTPIQKISSSFADSLDSKSLSWDEDITSEREASPPMPSIPPPPPPEGADDDVPEPLTEEILNLTAVASEEEDLKKEPYGIALYDYFTDHPEDLCFSAGARIKLVRRIDQEWLFGSLRNGAQGIFPSNYVDIKVPLPNDVTSAPRFLGTAVALYDFEPDQAGDLRFLAGNSILVHHKINDEWYIGECNGVKGQFPVSYVQMS